MVHYIGTNDYLVNIHLHLLILCKNNSKYAEGLSLKLMELAKKRKILNLFTETINFYKNLFSFVLKYALLSIIENLNIACHSIYSAVIAIKIMDSINDNGIEGVLIAATWPKQQIPF